MTKEDGLEPSPQKTRYFQNLAAKYRNELRLAITDGKLGKFDEWRNVVEHSLVAVAATTVLTEMLNLPESDKIELPRAAAVHDWDKRLEKDGVVPNSEKQIRKLGIDPQLIAATHEEFASKALQENGSTFLQRILYYVDNLIDESDILPALTRLERARLRDLKKERDETATQVRMQYWDQEVATTQAIEAEIYAALPPSIKEKIGSSDQIPLYIRKQIEENYDKS